MRKPKVSIIVPVYNSEPYLAELLDSLLNQSLSEIEIICVDDCSSDSSLAILEQYASKDERVKAFSLEKNSGSGAARNEGIKHITGDYLCFIDSDDFVEPNMLADLVDIADSNEVDVVIFNIDQYREQEKEFKPMPWAIVEGKVPAGKVFDSSQVENFYKYMVGFTVNKLYRSSYFIPLELSFPDIGAHEDMPFTYAAVSASKRVYYHDQVLYHYRRQREGSRSDQTDNQFIYMLQALECMKSELVRLGLWESCERNFENYALHMAKWKYDETKGTVRARFQEALCDEWANRLGMLNRPDGYYFLEDEASFFEDILDRPYVVRLEDELSKARADLKKAKKKISKLEANASKDKQAGSSNLKGIRKMFRGIKG